MDGLPEYSNTCAYCFTTINESPISFCCSVPICSFHLSIHESHTPIYSVKRRVDEIIIESHFYDKDDKNKIKRFVESKENGVKSDYEVVYKNDCPHKESLLIHPNSKTKIFSKCYNCEIDRSLYLCLICGFVGCSRKQYVSVGNGHASKHYDETGHSISTFIEDLNIDGSNKSYCYPCDDFVKLKNINENLKKLDIDLEKLVLERKTDQKEVGKDSPISTEGETEPYLPSQYVGIRNSGNSCYISTILHLLSLTLSEKISLHYFMCSNNPLECLFCQFVKIIIELIERNFCKIEINTFANLVEYNFEMFKRGFQQDPNEFLMILLQKLKSLDSETYSLFPKLQLKVKQRFKCDDCKKLIDNEIKNEIINLKFEDSVQEGLNSYFENEITICECKGQREIRMEIIESPDFMILAVNRCIIENREVKKIKKEKEFVSNEIVTIKNGDKYKKMAVILHKGDNTNNGHYFIKIGEFYVDDVKITSDILDGDEYMFLYKKITE